MCGTKTLQRFTPDTMQHTHAAGTPLTGSWLLRAALVHMHVTGQMLAATQLDVSLRIL